MSRRQPEALDLVVDALATYRITRLVVEDTLTQPIRERIIEEAYDRSGRVFVLRREGPDKWQSLVADDADPPKLAYLVTCPWCSGVYVAVGVVAARYLVPRAWRPVARAAALAAASALVALAEKRIEADG